jgi:hypothetical protein
MDHERRVTVFFWFFFFFFIRESIHIIQSKPGIFHHLTIKEKQLLSQDYLLEN